MSCSGVKGNATLSASAKKLQSLLPVIVMRTFPPPTPVSAFRCTPPLLPLLLLPLRLLLLLLLLVGVQNERALD